MIPLLAWRARRKVADLEVSKAFKPVFCKSLAEKMLKYRLDKPTFTLIAWMCDRVQPQQISRL